MRFDLHNHTSSIKKFLEIQQNSSKATQEAYLYDLQYHQLDGLAITNHHDIAAALHWAKEYPQKILIGCEYRVDGEEGTFISVVVLNLTEKIHQLLLRARHRGLGYFTMVLKEHHLPFYLAHLGTGIPPEHPYASELLEDALRFFDAIAVLDASGTHSDFPGNLAKYYGLAVIGGTGDVALGKRAYTESSDSSTVEEFFAAIQAKKVTVGLTSPELFEKSEISSLWQWSKSFYREKMEQLWHSEWNWHKEWSLNELLEFMQMIFAPAWHTIPQASMLHQSKVSQEKLAQWEVRFANYLKAKSTQEILRQDVPIEQKKQQWKQAIAHIHSCFRTAKTVLV